MSNIENEITAELEKLGTDFVRFVDISGLTEKQTRSLPRAIVFGLALTPGYIEQVRKTSNYVAERVKDNFNFDDDEYYLKELKADEISDKLAQFIVEKGYRAYSQSDANQMETADFDGMFAKTLLPHKTIALMAGLGFVGKNNLLITTQYGAAQTLGTVLTDAPLTTVLHTPELPACGECKSCLSVCATKALKNTLWNKDVTREDMLRVSDCTTCLRCMVNCPFTRSYAAKKKTG